jgi:putative membrane protein
MFIIYLVFWITTAISPIDRTQWLIENLLPVGMIIVLVLTFKRFQFTNLSYLFMLILLILHTYAAHYTYQHTPFDIWLKHSFHTQRSYFDRVVHFAFGLFLTYPIRELLTRVATIRGFWSYAVPIAVVFSFSALFEVVEMLVALVAGQAGADYIGLQGDIFDTQKDMGLGLLGGIVSMGILVGVLNLRKNNLKKKRKCL